MECPPQHRPTRPSFPSLYNLRLERFRECEQIHPSVTYLETAGDIFRFTLYWTLILYTPLFVLPALWGLFVHFIPHRISRWRRRRRDKIIVEAETNHEDAVEGFQHTVTSADPTTPLSSDPFVLDSPVGTSTWRNRTLLGAPNQRQTVTFSKRPTPRSQTLDSWTSNRFTRTFRGKQNEDSYVMEPIVSAPSVMRRPRPRPNAASSLRNRSAGMTCLILAIPLIFVITGALIGVMGSLVIGYSLAALRGTAGVKISTWIPLGWAVIQVHTVLLGCFTNMISFI
ncbi:hypothetical protein FRB91_002284 [Serendipita sp. 411]|nr:hypothetical protein FRC18_008195 [Serendipita sp. 400]KAG8844825.1 hypothetical protein FRB91_002284 [Serendipita sp. 411]